MVIKINPYSWEYKYVDGHGNVIPFSMAVDNIVRHMKGTSPKIKFFKLNNFYGLGEPQSYNEKDFTAKADELLNEYGGNGKAFVVSLVKSNDNTKIFSSKVISLGELSLNVDNKRKHGEILRSLDGAKKFDCLIDFAIADIEEVSVDLKELSNIAEVVANTLINNINTNDIYHTLTKNYIGFNPHKVYPVIDLRASAVIAFNKCEHMLSVIADKRNNSSSLDDYKDILEGNHPEKSILAHFSSPDHTFSTTFTLTSRNGYSTDRVSDISEAHVVNVYEIFDLKNHLGVRDNISLESACERLCDYVKESMKYDSTEPSTAVSSDPLN